MDTLPRVAYAEKKQSEFLFPPEYWYWYRCGFSGIIPQVCRILYARLFSV